MLCRLPLPGGRDTARVAAAAVRVEVATDNDLRGWLDPPTFSDGDYALLAANEESTYRALYLTTRALESILLVAKEADSEAGNAGTSTALAPWDALLGLGGSSTSSRPKIVGCIGCEVQCFRSLTGEQVTANQYDGGKSMYLRPVMADLAVSRSCRGRGVARALIAELEETVRKWGYDEVALLVELTNFEARAVYSRLGYRLTAVSLNQPTSYLETAGGQSRIAGRRTVALVLRKSLRPFPIGALENLNWGPLVGVLALLAAGTTAEPGQWEAILAALPPWLAAAVTSLPSVLV